MGGHGHVYGNEHNIKESDEEMLHKIQRIGTIKHMPNHWHMEPFNGANIYNTLGGAPAFGYSILGAGMSFGYYLNKSANLQKNFYAHNTRSASRLMFGAMIGLGFGYLQFGDRQTLHNAWVAERLRRRYPESMELVAHDLWKLKGVHAP